MEKIFSSGIFNDLIEGLESWCLTFNYYAITLFLYLKYIFVMILFCMGILVLLKLRGVYFSKERILHKNEKDFLKKLRLTLGSLYIFMAVGICFNFLTYMLIILLDPLPDRLIFSFINFSKDIDPLYLNRFEDIDSAQFPHEKTIYYLLAMGSFLGFLHLLISITLLLHNNLNKKPRLVIMNLIDSLIECILLGFTTFMPLFLI